MDAAPRTRWPQRGLTLWRHAGWGLVTLAAFMWHFRYLETTMPYWGDIAPTRWRLCEALALIPLAVALNGLFRHRQAVAVVVLVGFWLTLAGPFDVKLLELNAPLLPSDVTLTLRQIANLQTHEQIALSLWMLLGSATLAAIALGLWRAERRRSWLLVGAGLLSAGTVAYLGYHTIIAGRENTNPRRVSTRYGHLTYYAANAIRWYFDRMPDRQETLTARRALQSNGLLQIPVQPTTIVPAVHRDKARPPLYVILAESWIDPLDLGFTLSQDPFPPRLRAWIRQSRSRLLVSNARGGTASTEFELLYGMPAQVVSVGWGLEFRQYVRQPVPGLAAQLRQAGVPCDLQSASAFDFYAEHNAYRCAGFEAIRLGGDFDRSDLDGTLLADGSFLTQALTSITSEGNTGRPALHYLITMAGHYAFPLNLQVRPRFITSSPRSEGVESLVNRVAYSSQAILAAIDGVKRIDPEATVVVFGDHSPQPNPEMAASAYYQNPETAYSTPVLWLDRCDTPRPLGRIPAYGLHYRILDHFGLQPRPWAEPFARAAQRGLRNYPEIGRFSYQSDTGGCQWCPDPRTASNGCIQGSDFFKNARVITRDVLSGSQHSLQRLDP